MDTYAILAALDAQRLGMDPYAYNPLNYFGGPHVYSHWWLMLDVFPITRSDSSWLGFLVVSSALVAAWWILRPRNLREVIWGLLILCSAPVVLGLNRANVDLLLFVWLSLCVPCLMSTNRICRVIGAPLLVALAMGLKYYPAVAGLIILAARPGWERRVALIFSVGLFILVGISVAPELTKYTSDNLPAGLYAFGAQVALLAAGLSKTNSVLFSGAFLLVTGWWFMNRTSLGRWSTSAELKIDYYFFILGAVILTGSFIATVNYGYRWNFGVWMIPFLCRAPSTMGDASLILLMKITRGLLVMALWSDSLVAVGLNLTCKSVAEANRWIELFACLQQPFIWAFFVCLSGWLLHFVITAFGCSHHGVGESSAA